MRWAFVGRDGVLRVGVVNGAQPRVDGEEMLSLITGARQWSA
jgi:hypothetical protein